MPLRSVGTASSRAAARRSTVPQIHSIIELMQRAVPFPFQVCQATLPLGPSTWTTALILLLKSSSQTSTARTAQCCKSAKSKTVMPTSRVCPNASIGLSLTSETPTAAYLSYAS